MKEGLAPPAGGGRRKGQGGQGAGRQVERAHEHLVELSGVQVRLVEDPVREEVAAPGAGPGAGVQPHAHLGAGEPGDHRGGAREELEVHDGVDAGAARGADRAGEAARGRERRAPGTARTLPGGIRPMRSRIPRFSSRVRQ